MQFERSNTYGPMAIVLHWSVALLFLIQIPLGFAMTMLDRKPALQFALFQWHKSLGFLMLALASVRLVWSLAHRAHEAPEGVTRLEWRAARTVQFALLVATLLIPLTGWAVASSSPLRIPSYVFDLFVVPGLPIAVSDAAEAFWSALHGWLAYGTGFLILLHGGAALFHHLYRRDAVLRTMLPFLADR
ncbi:cytochrome b [Aureimonas sp. AU40]|uniref:cytochrome b n=1 Tax=Aureimonas sp. AU40 TaxID=1637747 RepID=UPI0007846FB4|nr:cytochrome b [Aureimonas sp. AU40]